MNFIIETNLKHCRQLWQQFSPKKNLFDLWNYRFCFFDKKYFKPHFVVGYKNNKLVGLLPLWFEKKDGFYTFFGGTYPEPNTFFINDKTKLNLWLAQCPSPTELYDLTKTETVFHPFELNELRYSFDLNKFNGRFEECVATFDQKHRKNLRYDLKQFEKNPYTLRFNQPADFYSMIKLNQARFKGESDYQDPIFQTGMKKLMETALDQNRLTLISLLVNNRVEAVEMAVTYNQTYTVVAGGHNLQIENIGKRMMVEHFRLAQAIGTKKIDFLSTDSGWKKHWHMDTEPVFAYTNK